MSTFHFGKKPVYSILGILSNHSDDYIVLAKILADSLSEEQQKEIVSKYNEFVTASNEFFLNWESPAHLRDMLKRTSEGVARAATPKE